MQAQSRNTFCVLKVVLKEFLRNIYLASNLKCLEGKVIEIVSTNITVCFVTRLI